MNELTRLSEVLTVMKIPHRLELPNKEIPFEQLFISLDRDEEKEDPDFLLHVCFLEERIQFFCNLPLTIPALKLLETHRLLALLNRPVPYGTFGLTEVRTRANFYFRYRLMTSNRKVSSPLILAILEAIPFFIHGISNKVYEFLNSNKSIETIVEEFEQDLTEVARKPFKNNCTDAIH